MSDIKNETQYVAEQKSSDDGYQNEKHAEVATVKITNGDEAFMAAMMKHPPRPFSKASLLLYVISAVAFCCSTTNGYDGSLFGTLLNNEDFKEFFKVSNAGAWTGIVTAMYQIGSVVAIPFIGPAMDTWGRRAGMFMAAGFIMLGVIVQISTVGGNIGNGDIGRFMGGRFLLGFGVGIIGAAGPTYTVEISHPAYRGVVTGLYNVFWPVGALVASCAARGALAYKGTSTSWAIPVGLQMMFPAVVFFGAWFLPESPRWQYTHGRTEEARKTLTKYHGEGNPDNAWVTLQMSEYEEHLEMDGTDKRWWDYRALFRDRASRYRLLCACSISLMGQWAGNGIVSYYLSAFLDTAGIKGETKKINVQVGMNAVQIVFASAGASMVDRFGRRPMLIIVNIVCALCWVGITVACSIGGIENPNDQAEIAEANVPASVSSAVLAWVYLFQIFYSFGWTPMQALYPVETLSFEMRAKGMAFSNLFTSIGLLVNQFGIPVALEKIAWRTYIVFCVWCVVQSVIIYFFIPETKNRTLEELDSIFHSKNPRKASVEKKKLEVDHSGNVLNVEPASV